METTTLPKVPKGEQRAYHAQMIDGKPAVLNAMHTTPTGRHVDRWTADKGWVDYPADLPMVAGFDDPTTPIDPETAESYADAGIGQPSGELAYEAGPCSTGE